MANRLKGDVTAEIAGRPLTLRIDMNAMCELEGVLGRPARQILEDMNAPQPFMRDIRAMLHAALRRHHPELSLLDAGDLLDRDGPAARTAIMEALSAAIPASGDDPEKKP